MEDYCSIYFLVKHVFYILTENITFLLQKIGTYVDPRLMVQRIDPTMEIPGLKKALVKMMCDYNLQVSVQEGCKKILASDYFNLHERLVRSHDKGIFVDDDQMCGACHRKVIVRGVFAYSQQSRQKFVYLFDRLSLRIFFRSKKPSRILLQTLIP